MELRQGYKQTEVGVIPEDWDALKLGSVASFKTGPFGSALHKSDYVINGIPVVNPMQIINGKIKPTDSMSISQEAAVKLSDFRLRAKDVVIGRRGEMGRCAFVLEEQSGWLCGTGSMIVRTNNGIDGQLLQRQLSAPSVIAEIENTSVGSTMINLNQATLSNLIIPLPPTLAEQEAIAGALSDVDGLISSLETLITKKRHIKQGAMQTLLRPKEGWVEKRLGEIAEIRDGTHQTPTYVDNGIPFYSVEHVTSGNFSNTKFISVEEHRFLTRSFKVEKGDILMTRIGSVGKCKLVDWDVDASFYVSLALLKIKNGYLPEYVCHYSETDEFQNEVDLNSLPSATPKKINLGPISDIHITIPLDLSEQNRIAAILSDMDAEITALETKLSKTRQLKQGMMAELLTGRIRLVEPQAQRTAEEAAA